MEDHPPGFRFYPTEEELISFYLHKKLEGKRQDLDRVIPAVNIYEFDPWHLPQISGEVCHGDPEQWFFFTPRQEREARGGRPNRITASGYWKATGSPGYVYSSSNRVIGLKKTMVFYKGKAPGGRKTQWKMNEYRAIEGGEATSSGRATDPKLRHEFSLCRVYIKSGCLRAFDRRPSGATTSGAPMHRTHGDGAGTSHQKIQNPPMVDKASFPESSSTGYHVCTTQTGETMEMTDYLQPLWEWEPWNLL